MRKTLDLEYIDTEKFVSEKLVGLSVELDIYVKGEIARKPA